MAGCGHCHLQVLKSIVAEILLWVQQAAILGVKDAPTKGGKDGGLSVKAEKTHALRTIQILPVKMYKSSVAGTFVVSVFVPST